MNSEELFSQELKRLLSTRNRKGGELFMLKRNDFHGIFSSDLRQYMTSDVLKSVGKNSYCYITEESNNNELFFLDVARGVRINGEVIDILGYFYENGQVVSYIIDRSIKKENNG